MSFVTAVRDYIDFINQSYDSLSIHGNLFFLVQHTLLYLFESFKYVFFYLLSFRWMADILYLPTMAPPITVAILRENFYPLENPLLSVFSLLEVPSFLHNKFFIGFLNSLFVSLPTSALHLLAGRRLLVEGIPAGVAAGLGTIVGQSFFLASILFGWRWVVIPWLSLEPLNYMVGLLVLLQTIYTICHAPSIKIVSVSERSTLINFFLLNLFLAWCEQSSLFQYVGNLTLTSDPSYVENFFATSRLSSLGTHTLYLMGFFLGSCSFTLLFALIGLTLKKWWLRWLPITTSRLINRLNFFFLVGVTALSLSSIPYYGLDYLFTKGIGFIPQDKAFQGTVLSPAGMADTVKHLGSSSGYGSLDTDATPFDQGRYLQPPSPQTFEDLNYQGEQYWTGRMDRKMFTTGGRKGKAFGRWANLFGERKKEVPLVVDENPVQGNRSISIEESLRSRSREATPLMKRSEQQETESVASRRERDESWLDDSFPWYKEFEESTVSSSVKPFFTQEEKVAAGSLHGLAQREREESDLEELAGLLEPTFQGNEDDSEKEESSKVEEEETPFNDFFDLVDAGFSPLFLSDTPEPTNLEKYLKKKFYENPVYHLLLRIDIDTFLSRQPVSHSLTPEQEVDLFRRRQVLADYYDSLEDYVEMQEDQILNEVDSEVYANHVYNHQFKGTLKVVRRLFSISLDSEENREEELASRVLKFDQPLFHSFQEARHPLIHEEVSNVSTHLSPFIEMTNSKPFYAGWDEQLRRLVITTRYFPRKFAFYGMRIPVPLLEKEKGEFRQKYSLQPLSPRRRLLSEQTFKEYVPFIRRLNLLPQGIKNSRLQDGKKEEPAVFTLTARKILFTAWPLPKKRAESLSNGSQTLASAVDGKVLERLNQFTHPDGEYHDWEIESWPENLMSEWVDRHIIPPTRGGFVWPGSSEFPFDVRQFLPDIKKFFQ